MRKFYNISDIISIRQYWTVLARFFTVKRHGKSNYRRKTLICTSYTKGVNFSENSQSILLNLLGRDIIAYIKRGQKLVYLDQIYFQI